VNDQQTLKTAETCDVHRPLDDH